MTQVQCRTDHVRRHLQWRDLQRINGDARLDFAYLRRFVLALGNVGDGTKLFCASHLAHSFAQHQNH